MNKIGKWFVLLFVTTGVAVGSIYYVNKDEKRKEVEMHVRSEGNEVVAEVVVDEQKSDKEVVAALQEQAKKLAGEHKGKNIHLSAVRDGETVAEMTVDGQSEQTKEKEKTEANKQHKQESGTMNITTAKKAEFLAGTYAYKIAGKLSGVQANAVVVKIGSQTFEQAVSENGEFEVTKLVKENVAEATVETKGGDETLLQKVTF